MQARVINTDWHRQPMKHMLATLLREVGYFFALIENLMDLNVLFTFILKKILCIKYPYCLDCYSPTPKLHHNYVWGLDSHMVSVRECLDREWDYQTP